MYQIDVDVPMPVVPMRQAARDMKANEIKNCIKNVNVHDINQYDWICDCVVYMYSRQTNVEQTTEETVRRNRVGFSTCDANFLSEVAKDYMRYGSRHLKPKEMERIVFKLFKYAGQLVDWDGSDYSGKCEPEFEDYRFESGGN
jgi:hypothetical protein